MYSKVILISLFIYISSKSYSFSDYSMKEKYIPMTINTTKYNSSSPCVTFDDLVAFHYTDNTENADQDANASPENFCYFYLTYNITREDFFNIIQKNINAFKNYRKMIPLYYFYNYTGFSSMDDGCVGYLKNVVCYSEFPACLDNNDGTFSVSSICSKICSKYKIRCGDFYFPEFCTKQSHHKYCPGNVLNADFLRINLFFLVLLFIPIIN